LNRYFLNCRIQAVDILNFTILKKVLGVLIEVIGNRALVQKKHQGPIIMSSFLDWKVGYNPEPHKPKW